MKLEISHSEIVSGITAFLASKGISGFDPAVVQVTFSTKRGTGELSAVLDTDPAPAAPAETKPAAAPKAEAPKETPANSTPPAEEAKPAVEAEAAEQATIDAASGVEPEGAAAAATTEEDNLFD